jgi:hypothetical protein
MSATMTETTSNVPAALEAIDRLADLLEERAALSRRIFAAAHEMTMAVQAASFSRWEHAVWTEADGVKSDIRNEDETEVVYLSDDHLLGEVRELRDLVKAASRDA